MAYLTSQLACAGHAMHTCQAPTLLLGSLCWPTYAYNIVGIMAIKGCILYPSHLELCAQCMCVCVKHQNELGLGMAMLSPPLVMR